MIVKRSVTFTRPDNATVYTAGDVVGSGTVLDFGAVDGESAKVVGSKLSISWSNVTNALFQLFLFDDDTNIPSLIDNAAFVITAALEDDMMGYNAFALEVTGTSGSAHAWDSNAGLSIPYGRYGVLVATAAYNPISGGTTVDLTLYVEV